MTDPQEPQKIFLVTSQHTFISFAKGEILHDPSAESCFLPTSLSHHGGEWDWNSPAYATVIDTPMTDKLVQAALVVMRNKLADKVVLPPNIKMLSEKKILLECHKSYIKEFSKSTAIFEYCVHACYGDSEDPNKLATMKKAFENWRLTCNKLIFSPNFSTGWRVPAFFLVYNMYCTNACLDYFKKQKELYAIKEDLWEEYLLDALAVVEAWRDMFVRRTSPQYIAFPKCLWYHRYFFLEVKEQPGRWRNFFEGSIFDDRGIISVQNESDDVAEVVLPNVGGVCFDNGSPSDLEINIQE
mmetsp:Transcript_24950/g.35751  ORF Transcript_24950/g.35751 Transcript_24950/m.35751 type:complete len:298 (-) Transcript_24950:210-1103(-)